jgi:hypothetical protein
MTVQEMHTAFKLGLDKVDSFSYPSFEDHEIDFFLNKAQERIVKQRLGINNIKRQSFEETQKRTEDLRELVRNYTNSTFTTTSDNKPNGVFSDLPSDYWISINDEADVQYSCNNTSLTERVLVKPVQHDDYFKIIRDPFNKPSYKEFIIKLMYDNKVELITGNNETVLNYYMRYIKKPAAISLVNNVDCELSTMMHDELVDEAVKIVLEDIESPRGQTFKDIQNTNE